MADRETKVELFITWDDETHDHPEAWFWEILLGVPVNRVRITDVEDE
jgi:hypothetical protein